MEHVTFPVLDQECTRVETHEVIEVERDASGALVFSLPVAAGFGVVEEFLGGAAARFDGAQWFFGNVFGPDGQPLNWWL